MSDPVAPQPDGIYRQKLPQSGIDNFRVEDGVEFRENPAVQPPSWAHRFDQFPFDELHDTESG